MHRTSAGRHPVLPSLSEFVSDQRVRRRGARHAAQSGSIRLCHRAQRARGAGLELAAVPPLRADDEYACQSIDPSWAGKFTEAMREIERGRDAIIEFFQRSNFPELAAKSSEVAFLEEWLQEVRAKRPLSKLEMMQREMEKAIASELYERAAELRDAIRLLETQSSSR